MKLFNLFMIASLAAVSAYATDYAVDGAHTNVNFTVKHMFSKLNAGFDKFEGSFKFDEKKTELNDVRFEVKADSINTKNQKRDDHLKSPDFFDVAKFDKLTFASKKPVKFVKGKGKLEGDLTIHGVTRPVSFQVEYLGGGNDPWGNTKASFTAETKIMRKDYGVIWNKTLDGGGLVVGEEVAINLNIEADAVKAAK